MTLSLKRLTRALALLVLSATMGGLTGCTTASPEVEFQEYDPGVWTPPAQSPAVEAAPAASASGVTAAEDSGPGSADVFHVGDTVNVAVTGVSSEAIPPHEERIKDDGTISLYLIGSVPAAGRTAGEMQRELQKEYQKYFKNPVVTVNAAPRFYYVGGEVKRPGAQPYLGETTVTKAIQAAGDFTDFARKTSVRVIRADNTTLKVNFNKAIDDPSLDPPIYPGDKIHVTRRIIW